MKENSSEKNSELFAGRLVQVLVIIAAFFTASGGILFLISSANDSYTYNNFIIKQGYLTTLKSIIIGVLSFDSKAIIQLGVLILISIPVIRVAVFLLLFLKERDWIYVMVSVIVMTVLIYSLLGNTI